MTERRSGVSDNGREQDRRWSEFAAHCRRATPSSPAPPFAEQWAFFRETYADRTAADGPPRAWTPDLDVARGSNLGRFMVEEGFGSYEELHRWSVAERAAFWEKAIRRLGIAFARPPQVILDPAGSVTKPRWLSGALMNCVDSCFQADPNRIAIVSGEEGSDRIERITYRELARMVDRVASGFARAGYRPGDGIALYMPMTVECVVAYLGIIRAGGFVVSIADSFPASELRKRLEIGRAKGMIAVDRFTRGGRVIDLYEKVIEAKAPRAIVIQSDPEVLPSLRNGDIAWEDFLAEGSRVDPNAANPYVLANLLFSSGTTGTPKAIPWSHLMPIKCAMDGHFHQDIRPADVVAWPTNIGWMMGPWLIYATLMNGAAMALYQGSPAGEGFLRFVERAGITILGLVPSLVRAWRARSAADAADWSRVRLFSSTGEPSNQEDYLWLMSRTGYRAPVIEYCGGTEIGGGYITGTIVQPASPAAFTTPALGIDFHILDEAGRVVADGESGEVFLVPPSIGLSQSLLNADHEAIYHAGCPAGPGGETLRRHGDQMARLPCGFYRAQGRADDTMNLGGIKVGSLEIERVVDGHESVAESAAIGVQVGGEGAERLVLFVVASPGAETAGLREDLGARIAGELNPLFKVHDVVAIDALPRTATNKVMRRELRTRYREKGA